MAKYFPGNKNRKKIPAKKSAGRTALQATMFAIVFVLIILTLLIVELRPVKSVSSWGGPEESLALATITTKVFTAANQRNSGLCRIIFTKSEVNALLTMLLRMYANEKKTTDPPVYAEWLDGFSDTSCSVKFAGIYLNFYLAITPSYNNGKLYLRAANCRLGKLPLPDGMVEKALNDELNKLISKDRRLQNALLLLHSFRAEKSGEVQIEFLRKNSGKLIRSFL